jgi:hypothetical protein
MTHLIREINFLVRDELNLRPTWESQRIKKGEIDRRNSTGCYYIINADKVTAGIATKEYSDRSNCLSLFRQELNDRNHRGLETHIHNLTGLI